jgi:hypothetical protein
MLRHIIYVSTFAAAIFAANPALAFETQHDTEVCRKELAEFQKEASITNMLLLDSDQSTHPQTGFLRHDDVFDKRIWLRGYSAQGSDAFYALPPDATADDCRRLEAELSNDMYWLAKYVVDRDPDRCRKYEICN